MKLHEYQAKQLFAQFGVAVPPGEVCSSPDEVKTAAEKLLASGCKRVVVKSQIHAGGRGKGTFQNGFKGGVHVIGRRSPHTLYSEKVVTFEDDAGAYDQRDAAGFIKLNALRLRLLGRRDGR